MSARPAVRRFDPGRLRAAAASQSAVLDAGHLPAAVEPTPEAIASAVARGLAADVTPDPAALRIAVRILAIQLAAGQPGRSVELRIPPYVAVQCIPGPPHTRGTPPNIVETDGVTFVALAYGLVTWDAAVRAGQVHASGQRADLRPYLPLDVPAAKDLGP